MTRIFSMSLAFLWACDNDDPDEGPSAESACEDYCAKRAECDDEVDEANCESDCTDVMEECDADDRNGAISDLTDCAGESCDDVLVCGIGQGLECEFEF
jgi:hypothetical protein